MNESQSMALGLYALSADPSRLERVQRNLSGSGVPPTAELSVAAVPDLAALKSLMVKGSANAALIDLKAVSEAELSELYQSAPDVPVILLCDQNERKQAFDLVIDGPCFDAWQIQPERDSARLRVIVTTAIAWRHTRQFLAEPHEQFATMMHRLATSEWERLMSTFRSDLRVQTRDLVSQLKALEQPALELLDPKAFQASLRERFEVGFKERLEAEQETAKEQLNAELEPLVQNLQGHFQLQDQIEDERQDYLREHRSLTQRFEAERNRSESSPPPAAAPPSSGQDDAETDPESASDEKSEGEAAAAPAEEAAKAEQGDTEEGQAEGAPKGSGEGDETAASPEGGAEEGAGSAPPALDGPAPQSMREEQLLAELNKLEEKAPRPLDGGFVAVVQAGSSGTAAQVDQALADAATRAGVDIKVMRFRSAKEAMLFAEEHRVAALIMEPNTADLTTVVDARKGANSPTFALWLSCRAGRTTSIATQILSGEIDDYCAMGKLPDIDRMAVTIRRGVTRTRLAQTIQELSADLSPQASPAETESGEEQVAEAAATDASLGSTCRDLLSGAPQEVSAWIGELASTEGVATAPQGQEALVAAIESWWTPKRLENIEHAALHLQDTINHAKDQLQDGLSALLLASNPESSSHLRAAPADLAKRQKTVLVVDDTSINVELAAAILRSAGYGVLQANSAKGAVSVATAELPDLVLLDVHMPGESGLHALKRLRKGQATQNIPVVMLTVEASTDMVRKCLHLGAVDYVLKPLRKDYLLERVRLRCGPATGIAPL